MRSLDEEFLLHRISKLEAEVEKLKNLRPTQVEVQDFLKDPHEEPLLQRISELEADVEKLKNRDIRHSKLIRMLAESIEALEPESSETQPDEHFGDNVDEQRLSSASR